MELIGRTKKRQLYNALAWTQNMLASISYDELKQNPKYVRDLIEDILDRIDPVFDGDDFQGE